MRDCEAKSVAALLKNVIHKKVLMVALERAQVRNQLEVVIWHPRSACALALIGGNSCGDKGRA